MTKNVTLAIDDRLLSRAREHARQHGLTLNSLVRALLEQAVSPPSGSGPDATFRLMDEAKPKASRGTWKREELYDWSRR